MIQSIIVLGTSLVHGKVNRSGGRIGHVVVDLGCLFSELWGIGECVDTVNGAGAGICVLAPCLTHAWVFEMAFQFGTCPDGRIALPSRAFGRLEKDIWCTS